MQPEPNNGPRTAIRLSGCCALVLLLWSSVTLGDVLYEWVDENGVRHYTNTRPPKDAGATVLMDEIPYDPEADRQRQAREEALRQEHQEAEDRERLENAERAAEAAERDAAAARRETERLARELEQEREADSDYGIYYPPRRHPGHRRPPHRPPRDRHPATDRVPRDRRPGYPVYEPFPTYPDKPWQQPRREPEGETPSRGRR